MKKEPGRVRYVAFEGDVFASVDDLIEQMEVFEKISIEKKLSAISVFNRLKGCFNSILATNKRQIPEATGNFKKLWNDKGSIN